MMFVMFITVSLGYLARKLGMMDDEFDSKLSSVVINITCPAVVLDSVLSNSNLPSNEVVFQILGVSCIIFIPVIAVSLIIAQLYRIPKSQRGGHAFTICFSNVGLLGFAVCDAILGSESILYIAIYNIICNLVLFSVGAWMVARSGTIKLSHREQFDYVRKSLMSPVMGACILALFLALFHITDSGIIGISCELIGAMIPAAAMLMIGSTLAKYEICSMLTNGWAYLTAFARLIIVPAIVYLVGGLFLTDPYQLASITLVCAMPAAMVGTMLSIMYGGDLRVLSQCMFLTTVFSVVTIPLVTMCII